MEDSYLRYTAKYKSIINGDKVILINRDTGKWMRISKECFDILNLAIKEKYEEKDLLLCLADKEDREYFQELIGNAKSMGIISEKTNNDYRIETVYLILTNRCNLNCKHCCVSAEGTVNDIRKKELDTDEFKMIIDKVIQCDPDRIIVSGGEPMIREDFIEILQCLRGKYSGKIALSTNAILINTLNVKDIVDNVDRIDISIDGVDESTCSIVRGKGVFNKVIRAIHLIKAEKFDEIYLSMMFGDFNKGFEDKFKELNRNMGTYPVIREFIPAGRGKENEYIFMEEKQKDVEAFYTEEELIEAKQGIIGIRCGAGMTDLVINYDGNVYPCANLMQDYYKLFNICEIDSITEFISGNIIEQPGYRALEMLQPENYEKCKECKVNLFCWTCLQDIENLKGDNEKFKKRCKTNKEILHTIIWK